MKKRNSFKILRRFPVFIFVAVISTTFFTPGIENSSFAQENNYLKKMLSPVSMLKARKSRPLRVTTDTLTMTGHTAQDVKTTPVMGRPPSTQPIITDPMMMTGRP
jgi:hypothetical protein